MLAMTVVAKTAFVLLALPAVGRAALRVAWLRRGRSLDQWVEALREVAPFGDHGAGAVLRSNPAWLAGVVDRLLPVLPPRRHGPCLKRSLILMDLWSRCGLEPTFHLGMQRPERTARTSEGAEVDLHAWVSTERLSTPSRHHEIWQA